MPQDRLRIYCGPEDETGLVALDRDEGKRETVTVNAAEVFSMLADAVVSNRTWLRDFADDEITVSTDLYDVILAYQHYRRPSA